MTFFISTAFDDQNLTYAVQEGISALPPIATAKADMRTTS